MRSEKTLNKKALDRVVDDLARAGFITLSLRTDKTKTMESQQRIDWSKKGTRLISQYAEALSALRKFSKRDRDMFNLFLMRNAADYLDKHASGK